jgi:hypothetical protein
MKMNGLFFNILLAIAALCWIACIFVYLSIQLHYSTRKEGFAGRLFLSSLKLDYTSVTKEMTPRDRKLYILCFVGIWVLFLPGGYFIGSILHWYLNKH